MTQFQLLQIFYVIHIIKESHKKITYKIEIEKPTEKNMRTHETKKKPTKKKPCTDSARRKFNKIVLLLHLIKLELVQNVSCVCDLKSLLFQRRNNIILSLLFGKYIWIDGGLFWVWAISMALYCVLIINDRKKAKKKHTMNCPPNTKSKTKIELNVATDWK